jgi:signal transduction histidine kinase/CheY-like chemotaxis protein
MNTSHKKTFNTLLFILLFLLALIAVIFFTQNNSQKNIDGLVNANENAATTFDINNRLEEIINYSDIIERNSRRLFITGKGEYLKGIQDTIKIIENHLAVIKNKSQVNYTINDLPAFTVFVQNKLDHIKNILTSWQNKTPGFNFTDSLLGEHFDERIYTSALQIQKGLDNNLKETLRQSNQLSGKILSLDKILSIVAILAIVILGTVIIKRLLEQLRLINTLALEKERADKSARIKEQFLANMSHEIRTPINAVVGFSNLLQKTPLQNEQKQFVDLIQTSGENLLAVVNDILDISKLEAGMMRISKNPFNIREKCMANEMMFYHKAIEKNISFSYRIDENIPDMLLGDAERLNQVMTNLINNAIKFTSKGEVNVEVKMKNKTAGKVDILFSVKDSGIGIPANKISAIFERFEQADSETSRQYGGTGLGLSIVKKIINLQGGEISVQSEPGKGSDFMFTISYDYIDTSIKPEDSAASQNTEKTEFNSIKALVAEDNITNQTLLKFILKQWNLEYDLAENGQQALQLMQKNKYDIVLMDIQMPVMDGYEAAQKIRKDFNKIPIIAMTAHVLPTEREKCINAGMNDYISKPLMEAEFLALLKKYLPFNAVKSKQAVPEKLPQKDLQYIDIGYLKNIFSGDNGVINEIMYQFRKQYPKELKLLKYQSDNKNTEGVKGIAHHLKTTVSALSINSPLRIHLDKIEDLAEEGDWIMIQQQVSALIQSEEFVLHEVDKVITSKNLIIQV